MQPLSWCVLTPALAAFHAPGAWPCERVMSIRRGGATAAALHVLECELTPQMGRSNFKKRVWMFTFEFPVILFLSKIVPFFSVLHGKIGFLEVLERHLYL